MRILLDTHMLIWATSVSNRLSPSTRNLIEDPANEIIFSAANLWEIAIKRALGRPDFTVNPHMLRAGLLERSYTELSISSEHGMYVANLPLIHGDPFDRLLLSQAIVEDVAFLTNDSLLRRYPANIIEA